MIRRLWYNDLINIKSNQKLNEWMKNVMIYYWLIDLLWITFLNIIEHMNTKDENIINKYTWTIYQWLYCYWSRSSMLLMYIKR
jgi:hypothetical protein